MSYRNGAEFIKALDECETTGDIRHVCLDFCRYHQFDDFLLCIKGRTVPARSRTKLIPGLDRGRCMFTGRETGSIVDSMLAYCGDHVTPRVPAGKLREDETTRHLDWLRQSGWRYMVCFPVHCPNKVSTVLVLMRRLYDMPSERLLPQLSFFALHLNEVVQHVLSADPVCEGRIDLTEREHECLLWAAEGMTIRETAALLGIAERTVIYHLQNAVKKLHAVNRCQAVARAVATGLVLPRFH